MVSEVSRIKHSQLHDPFPEGDQLLSYLQDFAAQNILVEPVSSSLRLRYYSGQYKQRKMILDGGFGEIARRQYLNRLAMFGYDAIRTRNPEGIQKFLRIHRADIFSPEFSQTLEISALQTIDQKISAMPPVDTLGIDNYVDLFSVRSRFPNFGGMEQARSDSYIMNFMPLAQPSFLQAIFSMSSKKRKNGKFFRKIIQQSAPTLKEYPLVKFGTTYPFSLSSTMSYGYVKMKNKILKPYHDSSSRTLLFKLKELVCDLVLESKKSSLYSYSKIESAARAYYNGDESKQKTVEWWLTFELWRRSLRS
jgi:hypothetical protein